MLAILGRFALIVLWLARPGAHGFRGLPGSMCRALLPTHHRSCPGPTTLAATTKLADDDGGIGQALDAAAAALEATPPQTESPSPEAVGRRSRALWRIGWTCWWVQLVLSVISAVVLGFARLVAPAPRGRLTMESTFITGGFFFSSLGLAAAFLSIVWSWHYTRLARRDLPVANVQSALRFGVMLNLSGMALTLISAEQVVGGLIAKLLLTPGSLAQLAAPVGTPVRTAIGPGVSQAASTLWFEK